MLKPTHRFALETAARFADGLATDEELSEAFRSITDLAPGLNPQAKSEVEIRRWAEARAVANAVCHNSEIHGGATSTAWMIERASHGAPNRDLAALVHDIFGIPFRFITAERLVRQGLPEVVGDKFGNTVRLTTFDPAWLTSTVVALARGMYESRDFSAMPILADALQDAGCENEDILTHCRGTGPHVRGCWVVDLVLSKS